MDDSAKIYLGIALMIVMIGMGLSLTTQDFKRIILYPKAIILGMINQLVFLPLVAYVLISFFDIRPALAIGLMILAACPGGPTSNLITHLCKGDTALSVSLTAVSSILTLFTIPLILEWSVQYYSAQDAIIEINRLDIFKDLLMVSLAPIALGMLIKHYKSDFAIKMEKSVKIASILILLVLIVGLTIKERANIIPYFSEVGLSALSLNIVSLALGFTTARLIGLNKQQSISISIESGIQNGTLAIGIAIGILQNSDYAIPAAVYSLIMFLSAFVLIGLTNWKKSKI
jgi:BASS family bile acid:Na+ symporter